MRKNQKQIVTIKCAGCGIEFDKDKKEIDRQTKRGRSNFFCNMSCAKSLGALDEFSAFRGPFKRSKWASILKKLEHNLSLPYLKELWEKQKGICPYTGLKMRLARSSSTKEFLPDDCSLDRIDSSKGYVQGNVEFVCLSINYAKNGFSKAQMVEFIQKIKNN